MELSSLRLGRCWLFYLSASDSEYHGGCCLRSPKKVKEARERQSVLDHEKDEEQLQKARATAAKAEYERLETEKTQNFAQKQSQKQAKQGQKRASSKGLSKGSSKAAKFSSLRQGRGWFSLLGGLNALIVRTEEGGSPYIARTGQKGRSSLVKHFVQSWKVCTLASIPGVSQPLSTFLPKHRKRLM
jgi:hypothetical protein